ncbi:MAG: hypothetical protein HC915_11615 [Anaerolineae bacterium]|nr:hypothetical protein [Anaerolineae bacterium]
MDVEIDRIAADFGEQSAMYRSLLDTPRNREDIANTLQQQRVMRRVIDIVTGKNPPIEATEEAPASPEVSNLISLAASGESTPLGETATAETPPPTGNDPSED